MLLVQCYMKTNFLKFLLCVYFIFQSYTNIVSNYQIPQQLFSSFIILFNIL